MNIGKFWSNVIPEPNSGCWLWLGPTFQPLRRTREYGRYGKRNFLAHRVSWALHNGQPGDKMVCHRCDNTFCVNPDHLFLGTAASNAKDKVRKNRQARGAAIRPTKITIETARLIKSSKSPVAELARQLGVSYGVVWNIRNGFSWNWV